MHQIQLRNMGLVKRGKAVADGFRGRVTYEGLESILMTFAVVWAILAPMSFDAMTNVQDEFLPQTGLRADHPQNSVLPQVRSAGVRTPQD